MVMLSTVVTVGSESSAVAAEDDRAAFAGSRKTECFPPATFTAAANGPCNSWMLAAPSAAACTRARRASHSRPVS